jgi:hypothetical protein
MWLAEKNYLKGYSNVSRPLATVNIKRKCALVGKGEIKLEA